MSSKGKKIGLAGERDNTWLSGVPFGKNVWSGDEVQRPCHGSRWTQRDKLKTYFCKRCIPNVEKRLPGLNEGRSICPELLAVTNSFAQAGVCGAQQPQEEGGWGGGAIKSPLMKRVNQDACSRPRCPRGCVDTRSQVLGAPRCGTGARCSAPQPRLDAQDPLLSVTAV
ncbi:unnamed protein product [Tetraodon nigroviridis]|uniref:(spotted green pufferfish) hypothetical protein n=1 Tax=Tetraodon nigroviridis TaxID=99883 RepID=Q4SD63_TETNG|nr:unnamed protein product [Tetraodon nigroviridis]